MASGQSVGYPRYVVNQGNSTSTTPSPGPNQAIALTRLSELHHPECGLSEVQTVKISSMISKKAGAPPSVMSGTDLPPPYIIDSSGSISEGNGLCRICHEGDRDEHLISPCRCAGSLGLVHATCVQRWLSMSNSDVCEICKYKFVTRRRSRPFCEWLRDRRHPNGPQGLLGDFLCLLLLTPLCLVSVYLCAIGASVYVEQGIWEGTGLVVLCCFLLVAYLLWCCVTVRYHYRILKRWRSTNQIVELVDCKKQNSISEMNNNRNGNRVGALELSLNMTTTISMVENAMI